MGMRGHVGWGKETTTVAEVGCLHQREYDEGKEATENLRDGVTGPTPGTRACVP